MISGGGTGGHIYPALAIAHAWKEKYPDSEILFVGAEGKMEMQKVPEAGYAIIGLSVAGLQRRFTLDNLSFPFKLLESLQVSGKLLQEFNPDAVVGVGGYASGPLLFRAQRKRIPTLIQEQNSYAGLTNKLLGRRADAICVAYPNMEKFFPEGKIHYTGNPVRKDILSLEGKKELAYQHFKLDSNKPVLLVLGGSLGAKTINQSVLHNITEFVSKGYQLLWQTGKYYFKEMNTALEKLGLKQVNAMEYIKEMDLAYSVADLVVSRAGALSVSELSLVGKAVIFIPSPNVVGDHQTKNAMAYIRQEAAVLLNDQEAMEGLLDRVESLINDPVARIRLGENIRKLAKPHATRDIVFTLEKLVK